MWTRKQAIEYAESQLGQTDGSLYFKIAFGYRSYLDWCAAFDSAIVVLGQLDCPYFPSTFAFDKRDLNVIGDRWVNPKDLQPGDFISFDFDGGGERGGDHVGIVTRRYGAGDYLTVEGNVSKEVGQRHRTIENTKTYWPDGSLRGIGIIGGIRPKYKEEKPQKLLVDGVFGPNTCRALQEALQKHGYYKGYLLDGDWGYYSKRETQRYLRALGYYTTAWLLDGWFGSASVKALQSYLRKLGEYGTEWLIDGDMGPATVRGLQRALNRGVF